MSEIESCFLAASQFVQECRQKVIKFYSEDFTTEYKGDNSPVTELDKAIEQEFRTFLEEKFPSHGLIGEEFGVTNPGASFQWVIDPIDGTLSLSNRVPTFGTMLALRVDNKPVLGIIDHPVLDISVSGYQGSGVTYRAGTQSKPAKISATSGDVNFSRQMVGCAWPGAFKRGSGNSLDAMHFSSLVENVAHLRIYYDCFTLTHVITGGLSASVEANAKIWDLAAAEFLVAEAGGIYHAIGEKFNGNNSEERFSALLGEAKVVNELRRILDC